MTRKNSLLLLAAPAAFLGFAAPAAAQQWTGAIDNDYNNAGNWDTGVVPNNAAADVVVNTMTNAPVMDLQTLGWRWYLGTLTIGDTADASLTFADGFAVTAAETVVAAHAGNRQFERPRRRQPMAGPFRVAQHNDRRVGRRLS